MEIYGGVSARPQIKKIQNGVDIVIATPGRLLDHVRQGNINLSGVEFVVLDEADRMLDMGFIRDIKQILKQLPKQRQNLLFSATFSNEIRELAAGLLNSPTEISVATRNTTADRVEQLVHPVDKARKREMFSELIGVGDWRQVLVFTRTKHGANRLAKQLNGDGIESLAIHGGKGQGARTKALKDFKDGRIRVLVATDIAARGLDIDKLPHVVNFELPHVSEDYIHRIGRTARAGHDGTAISLVCVDELKLLKDIERLLKREIEKEYIPGYEVDKSIKAEPINKGKAPRSGAPRRGKPSGPKSAGAGRRNKSRPGKNARGAQGNRPGGQGNRSAGGVILAAANAYLGMFAGMTIASAIPAAVVSMAVLKLMGGGHILENNIVATGASAGTAIATGVIFTMPALIILGYWDDFVFSWVLAIAGLGGLLGVFFSVPLRRSLIVEQGLAFPEGKAAAEVLRTGENPGSGLKILAGAASLGGLMKLAATSGLRVIPDTASMSAWFGKTLGYFGTNLSPALFGVGYIVGVNIGVVMLAGGVIAWNIGIPIYTTYFLAADPVLSVELAGAGAEDAAYAIWSSQIRYLGVGAMLIGGIWTLFSLRSSLLSGIKSGMHAERNSGEEAIPATERDIRVAVDVPLSGNRQSVVR